VNVVSHGDGKHTFSFAPALGTGTKILAARVNRQAVPFKQEFSGQMIQPIVETKLASSVKIEIDFRPTVELLPPSNDTKTGDRNKGLKVVSTTMKGNVFRVVVEGLAGEQYTLGMVHSERVASVGGCKVSGSSLLIDFPAGKTGEFERREITIEIR
jgi:hypothetical protein